jgi:hypothetical protein
MMAAAGILGEYKGSQAREVLMTLEEYEQLCQDMESGDLEVDEDPKEEDFEDDTYEEEEDDQEDDDQEDEEMSKHVYVSEGQQEYMSMNTDDD